jgi:uncharacterized membrane protein YhfC
MEGAVMVSTAVLSALLASAVLSAAWPLTIFVVCRRRMTLAIRNVLVGAGVFFLFSQVLEKILNIYLLKANPATATWFYAHSMAFALYASLAAGVFEELGLPGGWRVIAWLLHFHKKSRGIERSHSR